MKRYKIKKHKKVQEVFILISPHGYDFMYVNSIITYIYTLVIHTMYPLSRLI